MDRVSTIVETGVALWPRTDVTNSVTDLVDTADALHRIGVPRLWLAQIPWFDALSLTPLLAQAVPGLAVGTSVVTLTARHPTVVAVQAGISQAASDLPFSLGLGLGGSPLERTSYGEIAPRPLARLEEFLSVIDSYRRTGAFDHAGEQFAARLGDPALTGATGFRLLVAAMAPRTLALTGRLADGTLTNLAGPRSIETFIAPRLQQAAEEAGRPRPQIVAAVAALITDQPDQRRATAHEQLGFYLSIPSYRAILDREGVGHPADLALIGDEATVRAGLTRLREAGATELILTQTTLGTRDEAERTWRLAAEITAE